MHDIIRTCCIATKWLCSPSILDASVVSVSETNASAGAATRGGVSVLDDSISEATSMDLSSEAITHGLSPIRILQQENCAKRNFQSNLIFFSKS